MKKKSKKVVVAGTNVRNIAKSARCAGFRVYSVAKYCDEDLKIYSDKVFCFEKIELGIKKIVELCQDENVPVVLSTGFEKFFKKIQKKVEVLGSFNQKVVDKLYFYKKLERAGIQHPEVLSLKSSELGLKVLCKPRIGGGGIGVFVLNELSSLNLNLKEYIVQKFLNGTTISAIVLRNENGKSICVSVNEVLSGWNIMNAKGFMYSGNITPYASTKNNLIREIAKDVLELFEVVGCAGVDMIVNDSGVYVLELNPRIPGSLDSFELSCDKNLFELHLAYSNYTGYFLRDFNIKPKRFACRAVYYSPARLRVYVSPTHPFYADIPRWGELFDVDNPVISIISTGSSRDEVVKLVVERKQKFNKTFCKPE